MKKNSAHFYYISFKSWILGGLSFFDFSTFLVIKFIMQINGWGKKIPTCSNSPLEVIKIAKNANVTDHFYKQDTLQPFNLKIVKKIRRFGIREKMWWAHTKSNEK